MERYRSSRLNTRLTPEENPPSSVKKPSPEAVADRGAFTFRFGPPMCFSRHRQMGRDAKHCTVSPAIPGTVCRDDRSLSLWNRYDVKERGVRSTRAGADHVVHCSRQPRQLSKAHDPTPVPPFLDIRYISHINTAPVPITRYTPNGSSLRRSGGSSSRFVDDKDREYAWVGNMPLDDVVGKIISSQ